MTFDPPMTFSDPSFTTFAKTAKAKPELVTPKAGRSRKF